MMGFVVQSQRLLAAAIGRLPLNPHSPVPGKGTTLGMNLRSMHHNSMYPAISKEGPDLHDLLEQHPTGHQVR